MKFDPDSDSLPKRSELPAIPNAPEGTAWFWGEHDEVCYLLSVTIEPADLTDLSMALAGKTQPSHTSSSTRSSEADSDWRDDQSRVRAMPACLPDLLDRMADVSFAAG